MSRVNLSSAVMLPSPVTILPLPCMAPSVWIMRLAVLSVLTVMLPILLVRWQKLDST